MNKISGIYQIQSKIKPHKIYVGSAINMNERWHQHLNLLKRNKHGNIKLQRHHNKYGVDDLQFTLLLECDKCELINNEQKHIDLIKPEFNICKIANSSLGVKRTKVTIDKLSKWQKGIKKGPLDKSICLKISITNKGRKVSPETRLKISNSLKGVKLTEERKLNISKSLTGRKLTYSQIGRKHSEETKRKISLINSGRKRGTPSDETKAKISQANKGKIPWNKKILKIA